MEELLVVGGVGVLALIALGAIVGVVSPETGKMISDTGRNAAKSGVKLGMETYDKLQGAFVEAGQSWDDLVAEAKQEAATDKNTVNVSPVEESSHS